MLFAPALVGYPACSASAPARKGRRAGGQEGLRLMAVKVHLEEGRRKEGRKEGRRGREGDGRSDGGENCNFFDGRVVRLTTWLLLLLLLHCLLTVTVCTS